VLLWSSDRHSLRWVEDGRDAADRILGHDWMDPANALLAKALRGHPERELIAQRSQETDENGERRWSLWRHAERDGWVELWLRPWPLGRFDERQPIRVGAWPEKAAGLEMLARAPEIVAEARDAPR
jgi:hypothetical protein